MALVTMLLLVIAALIRTGRRIFLHKRAKLAPQAGTAWATFSMQLAGFALLALLVYIAVLASHVSEITTFYQIGHLDPWLRFEVALAVLDVPYVDLHAFLESGVRAVRRPLRWITRVKFTIVTLSCLYLGWFLLFFHLMNRPSSSFLSVPSSVRIAVRNRICRCRRIVASLPTLDHHARQCLQAPE